MEKKEPPQIHLEKKRPLVVDGNTYISVHDFQLTKYDLEKAHRELHETEDSKISGLKELKKKLEGDRTVQYRTDEEYLLRYLRYCKFNCDKAYKVIRNFYSIRKKNSDFFTTPPDFETLLSYNVLKYIPYTDEQGRIILWFDGRKWKPEEMSLYQVFTVGILILDLITVNPKMQINGCVCIWDFEDVTLKQLLPAIYPRTTWLLSKLFQEAYPLRISGIIGLHTNSFIRKVFNAFRPILKKKIFDRIKLIGSDMTELHKYVNPALLPKDYGGTIEESECIVTQEVLQNLPYIQYENSFM